MIGEASLPGGSVSTVCRKYGIPMEIKDT